MIYFSKYNEKEDNWTKLNNQLIVKTSENDNANKGFEAGIIVFDDEIRNIKHYIKLSVILAQNGLIAIPSVIDVRICRVNNRDSSNSLKIQKVADKMILSTGEINKVPASFNSDTLNANNIAFIISEYINSFEELAKDKNIQRGLQEISSPLENSINQLITLWKNFDIDTYIEQQKHILKIQELEYFQRIKPIQDQIELLENIKNDNKDKTK